MDKPFLRSPPMQPARVIEVCAYNLSRDDLMALDPRVDATANGWALLLRRGRAHRDRLVTLCEALDVSTAKLTDTDEASYFGTASRSLGSEMISYLVHRDWSNASDAVADIGERLIVAPRIDDGALADLLDCINAHATCCRAAQFDAPDGPPLTLLHLRDDAMRGSSLQPFLQAYKGLSSPVLQAYATPFGSVFLPVPPPRAALAAVATLVDRIPELFDFKLNRQEGWEPEALLFAVVRSSDIPGSENVSADIYFDARKARFFGAAAFVDAIRPRMVQAVPVADAAHDIEVLRHRLQDPSGNFAFPLRLRRNQRRMVADDEIAGAVATLEADKRIIETKIANLRAQMVQQSVMLIAPEAEFPEVMNVLRHLIADRKSWDGIRYRCITGADSAAPEHVFHFDATIARDLALYGVLNRNPAIRYFWSDPAWTALYSHTAAVQIMVPFGTALTPLPHAWEADRMDRYLCEMTDIWSDGAIAIRPDATHVLLFGPSERDEGGSTGHTALSLSVFEADGFAALTGDTISWFNDLAARLADTAPRNTVETEARRIDEVSLALLAQETAPKAEAELNEKVNALQQHVTQSIEGLQEHLDTALAGIAGQVQQRATAIEKLEKAAADIEAKYEFAKRKIAEIERADSAFAPTAQKIAEKQQRSIDAFLRKLASQEAQFAKSAAEMEAGVDRMKAKLTQLNDYWFKGTN